MNNIDQINMFVAFLELVQNPAKYTEMLNEMKTQTNELKVYTEAYTDVQSANKYFEKLKIAHNLKIEALDKRTKEFEDKKEQVEVELRKRLEEVEKRKQDLETKVRQVMQHERELGQKSAQLDAALVEVQKQKDALSKKESEVVEKLANLTEKETKLKAVLGG